MDTMHTRHFPWHWLWILLAVLALMLLLPAHARYAPPSGVDIAPAVPNLVPRVLLEDHTMSREQPRGCERPAPVEFFFTGDAYAYLWFRVDGAMEGDEPAVHWIRPNGLLHRTDRWDPLPAGGKRCLTAALRIAGDAPADEPGRWLARVEWNGMLLLEQEVAVLDPSRPMITE
jgi:hypothetical protein